MREPLRLNASSACKHGAVERGGGKVIRMEARKFQGPSRQLHCSLVGIADDAMVFG
jgi:hypothetical protein